MRLPRLRPLRPRGDPPAVPERAGLSGPVRPDKRTKNLVKRLRPGDVAVIDHVDIDRVAAETLVEKAPVVVVNAAQSISGRYPNAGPAILVDAGIPLLDAVGRRLAQLARRHQVLVVTHLPQIAAHADRHFSVEKRSADGATSTDVRLLDDAGRVGELSRMLAGMEGSGLAQAHAEELLAAASAAKNGRDPDPRAEAAPRPEAAPAGERP